MHPRVAQLSEPQDCEQLAINVIETDPALALEARRRAVQLRAERSGAKTDVEREALEAVYAYEAVRTKPGEKKFRATRTWQMIDRHGIMKAVERAVDRDEDPAGYRALAAMNMQDLSFEAVVVRHAEQFEPKVVARCRNRLSRYESA